MYIYIYIYVYIYVYVYIVAIVAVHLFADVKVAFVVLRDGLHPLAHTQHLRQHTSAHVSIRQHI